MREEQKSAAPGETENVIGIGYQCNDRAVKREAGKEKKKHLKEQK